MTVKDFIKLEKSGATFRVVDATKVGYMTKPTIIIEAGRSVVADRFGDWELIGFSAERKQIVEIYVRPVAEERSKP